MEVYYIISIDQQEKDKETNNKEILDVDSISFLDYTSDKDIQLSDDNPSSDTSSCDSSIDSSSSSSLSSKDTNIFISTNCSKQSYTMPTV